MTPQGGLRAAQSFGFHHGWRRLCSAVALVAIGASACTHAGGTGGNSMTLQMLQGSATVVGGGRTTTVTDRAAIGTGFRVTVASGGLAAMHLAGGRTFELGEGQALITGPDRIQLVQGAALGQVSQPGQIDAQGVTAAAQSGTFRVRAGISTEVDVFAGSVTLTAPGSTLDVEPYREAVAAAGVLPSQVRPLTIVNGGDVWDHRYLQDAIDLDSRLANFGSGLNAQLGNATGRQFFQLVIPSEAELAYLEPFFSEPRADVLIGAVLASHAMPALQADPQLTFDGIMGLWMAGESWGVIAMEYHVSAADVFAGLLDAIHRVGISLATPMPHIAPIPVATPAPAVVAAPKRTPSPATTAKPAPPTPTPTPSPSGLLNQLLDPVTSLLNQILNLLGPQPTPAPAPAPAPAPSTSP